MSAFVARPATPPLVRRSLTGFVPSVRATNAALCVLGAVMILLTFKGAHDQNHGRLNTFIAGALALSIPYALASCLVWRAPAARSTLLLALGLAALFRIAPLTSDVYLSTDPYRYVWDGRVQAHGINPYRYVPADPHLAGLRDDKIYPHINRREYAPTVYPPATQWVFWALTRFSETIGAVRVTMVLFDALTAYVLVLLLRDFGLPATRVLLYAWHPLCIWEFAGGAHCDAAMLAAVAFALLMHRRGRPVATGVALAFAVLTKLFPLVMFPALYRRWRWGWRMPLAMSATLVLSYLPYVLTYSLRGALGFLPGYTKEEGFRNGERFYFLNMLPTEWLAPHGIPTYRVFLVLAALMFAAVAARAVWKPPANDRSDLRRCACVAALVLGTLSPAVGWYSTWLVVFLPILGEWWLAWISCSAFVLYFNWNHTNADEIYLQNSVIFLPALLLWAIPAALRRYRAHQNATLSLHPEPFLPRT